MEIQIRNLDLFDLPSLEGKFLVIETMSDGYTGTVEGRYNYGVEVKNGEYFIYPTHWDILRNQFVREPALVVYTDQNVVYFSANVNKDPYTPTDIKKLIVYDYMEKDKRVVQAFKIFANEAFSMGNYNLFLKDVIVKDNPAVKRVKGISLNPASLALSVGSKKTLLPVFDPIDASVKSVTWKSDNGAVASVNASGEVTGKSNGTANIEVKADDGDFTATAKATVTTAVTGVTLDKTNLALKVGDTGQLTATVAPAGASNKTVTYSSNATNVATVDNTGKVTAVANGSATITVKTTDGAKTAVCSVSVTTAVTGVTLDKTTANVTVGATTRLTATVAPSNATNKAITWKSGDASIATVDNTGKITGVKAGTTNVTVTTTDGTKTATVAVTVTAKPTEPEQPAG